MMLLTGTSFLVLLLLAVPVAFALGIAAAVGLWWGSYPLTILAQQVYQGVDLLSC